jgi:hypothetical protein
VKRRLINPSHKPTLLSIAFKIQEKVNIAPKKVLYAFSLHINAVAGWLGTYSGKDSISDISCSLFAGEVGMQRILDLFKEHNLKSTHPRALN